MKNRKASDTEEKNRYEEALDPEAMRKKLWRYRRELGREFGLTELLKLEDIRAKTRLAEAFQGMPPNALDKEV